MRKFENNKNIIKLNKLKKRLQVCLNMREYMGSLHCWWVWMNITEGAMCLMSEPWSGAPENSLTFL